MTCLHKEGSKFCVMTIRKSPAENLRRLSGGLVASEKHGPAFSFVGPEIMPLPVIVAAPHGGRIYPSQVLAEMRDAWHSQLRLEDRFIDLLASEVAKLAGTGLLIAHAPRAMLDLNRSREDVDWDMVVGEDKPALRHSQANRRARSGLGLVPRRLPGFGEVWRSKLPRAELARRVETIHRPYHLCLSKELERVREKWGAALLIDLHSMPPLRKREGQASAPKVVLGDRFGASCDAALINRAVRYFDEKNCPVAHNRPYAGGYVLDRHSDPARGLHAVQIEVCRSAYLDAKFSEPSAQMMPLAQMLAGLVRELGAETARLCDGSRFEQAAE